MKIESNVDRAYAQSVRPNPPPAKAAETATSRVEGAKQVQNQAILAASMQVSLSAGNQSLSLLYKTAIENLNQVLAPEFGEHAIEDSFQSGIDVSPEATAGRIVALSTGFFELYRDSNPDKDLATALKDFTELIRGGIDQGFAEAREILDGLGVLGGDIASNIDKTYELVQSGLQAFIDRYAEAEETPPAAPASAAG